MSSDPKKLLYDAVAASAAIREFCRGRSMQEYESNLMLQSACERQFEIIGEPMTRLRDRHAGVFNRIRGGSAIIAFRNRLIHGYDTVDSEIVWDVMQQKLPDLERVAGEILRENE